MIQLYKISSYVLIVLMLLSACAEARTTRSNRVRLQYRQNTYYELGAATAQVDYRGSQPFMTGVATGVALPFTTAASAVIGGPLAPLTGIAGLGLTLWAGNKATHSHKKPVPDTYLTDLGESAGLYFREGYEYTVESKRLQSFVGGTVLGVGIDLAIVSMLLWYAFRDFHGFGGA